MTDLKKLITSFFSPTRYAALIVYGLLIAPAILGSPYVKFGHQNQIDGPLASVWFFGGLAGLWMLWLKRHHPGLFQTCLRMPLLWTTGAFAVYIFNHSWFFQPATLQGWVGHPTIGEGLLTPLSLVALAPVMLMAFRTGALGRWFPYYALATAALVAAPSIIGGLESPLPRFAGWKWAYLFFGDFAAYYPMALIPIYWIYRPFQRYPHVYDAVLLSGIFSMAYFCHNSTLILALAAGLLGYPLLTLRPWPEKFKFSNRLFLALCLGLALVLVVLFSYHLIMPHIPVKYASTLQSRELLAKAVTQDLLFRPLNFSWAWDVLVGHGWGTYINAPMANLSLLESVSIYTDAKWAPSWEFLQRDNLHSHNLVVETFWSGGILGLGVLFLTIWGFCKGLSRRHAFVGTLFIVSYLVMRSSWFEMIYTAPFSFLAFALICTQRTATAPYLQRMTQSCLTFSPLLIVCSLVYAVYQKQIGDIYKCSTTETFVGKLAQIQQHPAYFLDRFTGAHRTTYLARAYASALSASELKDLKLSPQEAVQAIDQLAQFLSTQLTPRMSVPAALLGVNFYSELYAEKKVKEAFFEHPDIFSHWQKAVVNLLHAAPYRTDILQPYVTFLLQTQQEPSFVPLLHDLLQDHPHNIPALWFLGIIALRHPTLKPLGICLVNKALDHHIERLIPLEKGFIHQLKMAHDPEVSCEKKELDEIFSTFHQEYPSARD